MFDLERELQQWRREMKATGFNPEILTELEEHLREDIEQQLCSGAKGHDAFQAARQRIGKPNVLKNEFALISPPGVVETLRRHKWKILLSSGAGLLVAIALPLL